MIHKPHKEIVDAAKFLDGYYCRDGFIYSKEIMDAIGHLRGYEYSLCVGQWSADFPSAFRAHSPMRIPNQRHMLVTCEDIDKDPLIDDMAVLSGWGTDLGVDFQGQIGVVSNRSRFSQYYHQELGPDGQPQIISRRFIGECPTMG